MFGIYHDIEINASPSKIFDGITNPDKLNIWWTVKSSGEPSIGNKYNFYFDKEYNWWAKVINLNTPYNITFQMIDADDDWLGTVLSFSIIERSSDTNILRFEHTGWRSINDHFRRTSYCWVLYLQKLQQLLTER